MPAPDAPPTDKEVIQSQGAPYMDPPGMEEREFVAFEPLTLRAYAQAGGRLLWEQYLEAETQYASLAHECQKLIDRGLVARVDVLKGKSTDLLGCFAQMDEFEKVFGRKRRSTDPLIPLPPRD